MTGFNLKYFATNGKQVSIIHKEYEKKLALRNALETLKDSIRVTNAHMSHDIMYISIFTMQQKLYFKFLSEAYICGGTVNITTDEETTLTETYDK